MLIFIEFIKINKLSIWVKYWVIKFWKSLPLRTLIFNIILQMNKKLNKWTQTY